MRVVTSRRWSILIAFALQFFDLCLSIAVNLTNLKYDVSILSRVSDSTVMATFHSLEEKIVDLTLKLLIPENALISTFSMNIKGRYFTSSIEKRPRKKLGNSSGKNVFLIQHIGRAQVLEVDTVMSPGEDITLHVGYTEVLQRNRGRYHQILYLPTPVAQYLDLSVSIRIQGHMNDITFLKANGGEVPLTTIKHGTADVFTLNSKELKLKYRRNLLFHTEFTSVTHNNPTLDSDLKAASLLSFKTSRVPNLLLVDPAFVLSFDISRYADGGELQIQNGFFAHFLSPEGLSKLPVHTVFVLDNSGSMDNLSKLKNLKIAMRTILRTLRADDSFEIIVFSTSVKSFGVYTSSAKDIGRSISKINALRPYGGTNINDALMEAVYGANEYSQSNGAKQIVFLTDGKLTVGEMDTLTIRKSVKKANIDLLPIYALAFGNDTDLKFLRKVSGENRGFVRKIRSEGRPADQLKGFYEEISTPLLTELTVKHDPKEVIPDSVFRMGQDNFYSGDEIIVAGQLMKGTKDLNPQVNGKGLKGHIQLKVLRKHTLPTLANEKVGVVERLWAYLAVQDLLTSQELVEDNNIRAELRARALEIALKYNFVTRLTSLVLNDASNHPFGDHFHEMGIPAPLGGEFAKGLMLVSPEDFAATLPNELQGSIAPSQNRRFSFVDSDPHFVVQVPGLALPLCFDLHGQPGNVLSLVRDDVSGFIVNARVSAAIGRPGATYFTEIFVSLKKMNLTVTTTSIFIQCIHGENDNEVLEVWHESNPFEPQRRKRARRRKTLLKHRKRRNRHRVRRPRSTTISNSRHPLLNYYGCLNCGGKKFRYKPNEELISPIIDAYLEKDPSNDLTVMDTEIHSGLARRNFTWGALGERIQKKRFLSHFHYRNPALKNKFIIRSPNTIRRSFEKETETNRGISECRKLFKWKHIARRRYDDVEFTIRGRLHRKRLTVVVGDVDLQFVITNTRKKNNQEFLGFYIQEQKILSPNTTGVIGQFVYKSVATIGHFPKLFSDPDSQESKTIPLAVVHSPQKGSSVPKVNRVTAVVSRRRSLLHKKRVLCLHVKRHGKGLLAKRSKKYLLPNLNS